MTRSATRDAILVTGGRIGFVVLWFLAVLLVYRGLGSDEAGLAQAGMFAVAIACIKIASGCIVDPGDVAVMRRAPGLLRSDPAAAYRLLRAAFALRLAAGLVVVAALLAHAGGVGRDVVDGDFLGSLAALVAAAIIADMLFRSVMVVLQAQERFPALVLLEGSLQVCRLVCVLALWATGAMTVEGVLLTYAGAGFAAALCGGAVLLPRALVASWSFDRADLLDLLGFLKWMVPAMVLAAVNERLDVVMVYSFVGADEAGRYGAMVTLAVLPDLVAGCVSVVLQPRIARMRTENTYNATVRLFLRYALPTVAVAWLVAMLLTPVMVPLVLGGAYAQGVPALLWLLAGTLFWLAVAPLPLTMVAVHAPARTAMITIGQSATLVLGCLVLVPLYGAVGMAQAVCLMRVLVALAVLVMAHRLAAPVRVAEPAGDDGSWAGTRR